MRMNDESDEMTDTPTSNRIWVHEFSAPHAQAFADAVFAIAERDITLPIVAYIDSFGGEIDGLATMMSAVDAVPNPFVTIATGKAMSAGAILLSHGDLRYVGQHARVMIHEALGGAIGNVNDAKNDIAELDRLNEYFMGILATNCGKNLKNFKKLWQQNREIYLGPAAAVKFGLADHIGIPIVRRVHGVSFDCLPPQSTKGRKNK